MDGNHEDFPLSLGLLLIEAIIRIFSMLTTYFLDLPEALLPWFKGRQYDLAQG